MTPEFIIIQTLIVSIAPQFFLRREPGLILSFVLPSVALLAETIYFAFFASIQGGGASMLFPALFFWCIPISLLGFSAAWLYWWVHARVSLR